MSARRRRCRELAPLAAAAARLFQREVFWLRCLRRRTRRVFLVVAFAASFRWEDADPEGGLAFAVGELVPGGVLDGDDGVVELVELAVARIGGAEGTALRALLAALARSKGIDRSREIVGVFFDVAAFALERGGVFRVADGGDEEAGVGDDTVDAGRRVGRNAELVVQFHVLAFERELGAVARLRGEWPVGLEQLFLSRREIADAGGRALLLRAGAAAVGVRIWRRAGDGRLEEVVPELAAVGDEGGRLESVSERGAVFRALGGGEDVIALGREGGDGEFELPFDVHGVGWVIGGFGEERAVSRLKWCAERRGKTGERVPDCRLKDGETRGMRQQTRGVGAGLVGGGGELRATGAETAGAGAKLAGTRAEMRGPGEEMRGVDAGNGGTR